MLEWKRLAGVGGEGSGGGGVDVTTGPVFFMRKTARDCLLDCLVTFSVLERIDVGEAGNNVVLLFVVRLVP